MSSTRIFEGRKLLIATKHEKENVIAPILEKELGVKCSINPTLDTDILGTFTGEVERKDDPVTTAKNKCLMAMELSNCDLAVASEGSFGPHPNIYFVPADDELLFFIDKKNNLEIIAKELTTETNFNHSEIRTEKELEDFAQRVKFPSHGLIIKKDKHDLTGLVKGIINRQHLYSTFKEFELKYGKAFIETDMRAMYNPTRMKVIKRATQKLANKINSICPKCQTPGFGITDRKEGLPCAQCNFPTQSTLSFMLSCRKCAFEKEEMHPNNKMVEDPMYCGICNP